MKLTNNKRQAGLHASSDGFHLRRREADRVLTRLVVLVGAAPCDLIRFDGDHVGHIAFVLILLVAVLLSHVLEDQPEWSLHQLRLVASQANLMVGEATLDVLEVQESVVEVQRSRLLRHLRVVRRSGIAVAQENVVKPLRDDTFGVHQMTDRLQHRLEVVLLRLATHEDVEALVNIVAAGLQRVHVVPVLVRVEPHTVRSLVARQLRPRFDSLLDHLAGFVQQSFDFTSADVHESDLLDEIPTMVVLGADGHVRVDGDQEANVVTS